MSGQTANIPESKPYMFSDASNSPSHNASRAEVATQTDDNGCMNGCLSIYVNMTTTSTSLMNSHQEQLAYSVHSIHKDNVYESQRQDENPHTLKVKQEYNAKNFIALKVDSASENLTVEKEKRKKKKKVSACESINDIGHSTIITAKPTADTNSTLNYNQHGNVSQNRNITEAVFQDLILEASDDIPSIQERHSKPLDSMNKEAHSTVKVYQQNEIGAYIKQRETLKTNITLLGGSTNSHPDERHITSCDNDADDENNCKADDDNRNIDNGNNIEDDEIFDEDSSATIELPQNAIYINIHEGTDNQSLNCSICYTQCLSKLHLEEHMAVAHEKPFKCHTCEKHFKHQSSLNDHLRTHSGFKPFKCDVCGKDFGQRSHLRGHQRSHTNERPHQCEVCSKAFQFRSVLKQHMKIHSGVKPFSCPHCDKTFRQAGHLKVHLKIHLGLKPFECTLCGKRFREKTHLTLHYRSHSGERPYPCKVCEKSFKSSSDLIVHMRSHLKEKPFSCTVCIKRFASKRRLREHVSKKHVDITMHAQTDRQAGK